MVDIVTELCMVDIGLAGDVMIGRTFPGRRAAVPGNHPELTQRININPGEIELAWKEPGASTTGNEVMVIMPFTRKQSGPRLIDLSADM